MAFHPNPPYDSPCKRNGGLPSLLARCEVPYNQWMKPTSDVKAFGLFAAPLSPLIRNYKMKDHYQKQWHNLGLYDPYWAVLSDPTKKDGKWDKADFFASGQIEIEQVIKNLSLAGIKLRSQIALDFGCGVGRLTRPLSKYFDKVIGIDISKPMLDEAMVQNKDFENIIFLHNVSHDLSLILDSTVDFIYSNIVLQHMPAQQQLLFISEFCRILKAGGVAVFQTPSHCDFSTITGWVHFMVSNHILNFARRLIYGRHCIMEIHTLDKNNVLETLSKHSMSIAKLENSNATGKGFISYRYYAVKLSTGQKPQSPEEILEFLGEVKDDVTEEIKAVPEEGLKRTLKGFFKGMG